MLKDQHKTSKMIKIIKIITIIIIIWYLKISKMKNRENQIDKKNWLQRVHSQKQQEERNKNHNKWLE